MSGKVSVNTHNFAPDTNTSKVRVQCANCGFVTMADENAVTNGTAVCFTCKSAALDKVDKAYVRPDVRAEKPKGGKK